MSLAAVTWAWSSKLPPVQKLALLYLADGYHHTHAPSELSLEGVASFCSVSSREADSAISELIDGGYIAIEGGKFRLSVPEQESAPPVRVDPAAAIYVMDCDGLLKIGITRKLDSRVAAIQTSNPKPISLIHSRPAPLSVARLWERACHQKFADYRASGEWFAVSANDAITFISSLELPE